ncbi:hypothetical protein SGRA_0371 [Saprospira grandis str. Lewin]|uniref:Uncharacterized protein n=1 Tax=Saprospira grandis (strain Lewin) TaxID=984262 RepID=H6L8X4_SAPGL|nr:hypothetical protein SGRA_0371 [Saprospira grandis str. Lewin]
MFIRSFFFWGLPPSAAGPLQGSQVCSALRASPLVCRCAAPLQAPRPTGLRPFAAASPPPSRGCRLKPAANLGTAEPTPQQQLACSLKAAGPENLIPPSHKQSRGF